MRLYDFHESGNGYKVRLLLHQLGLDYERVELDILKGETRTREFLAVNPNGRIPALVLDDGAVLSESNAILFYLAEGMEYDRGHCAVRVHARRGGGRFRARPHARDPSLDRTRARGAPPNPDHAGLSRRSFGALPTIPL
jgi:glutathione S-transferase